MIFKSITNAKRQTGLSYVGRVNNSSKHEKAYKFNELVYTIYFSPADRSGYEVCPMRTPECTESCLNESGQNRMDIHKNMINHSRIIKTKLFFEEREFLVRWIIDEIKNGIKKANREGYRFSVRLNNTSDISPEMFYINDNGVKKNILQIFPDVQFYDYTKVPNRVKLMEKYPNYDVTFSFSGENWKDCLDMLKNNIRVAVVFTNLPETFEGYKVINGDKYDMRYLDEKNVIVGLKYKIVRNKLQQNNKFVIHIPK
jgi:hypothetical protein